MNTFSNELKYSDKPGQIKFSRAAGTYHFKGRTKGIALKYVAQGHETYMINHQIVDVPQGHFILLQEGEIYEAITPKNAIHINGICIDLNPDHFPIHSNNSKNNILFHTAFDCAHSTSFGNAFLNLQTEDGESAIDGNKLLQSFSEKLIDFSNELYQLQELINVQKTNTQSVLIPKLISLRDFIYKNYNSKITLALLARQSNISQYHLLRLYKRCFDQSPQQLQQQLRMKKAKQLILKEKHSCSDIAFYLGYNDLAAFSKQFKHVFGVAPSKYAGELKN